MMSTEASEWIDVVAVDEMAEGTIKGFEVEEKKYILCKFEGDFYALDGICSHAKGPLCKGALDERYIVCPWHGWEFDVVSGMCEIEPTLKQKTFAVKIESGRVYADVSNPNN